MDANMKIMVMKRLERTANALKNNNMDAYVVNNSQEAVELVRSLLEKGDVITSGGSMSLVESGVINLMRNGDYKYLDRQNAKDQEEVMELYRKAYFADCYLTSANAVTEQGEIYNVDGTSNRISAIAYGPQSVIFVVGYNKVVRNVDEAVKRVKRISAPANAQRLGIESSCAKLGECVSLANNGDMCKGCVNESRICCNYLVSAYQRQKGRFKVVLVAEELGY